MARLSVSFIAGLILFPGLGSLNPVVAGDGDVDYSAPYITVDPETGQLITVNPGPELKLHAPQTTSDSAAEASGDSGAMSDSSAADPGAGSGPGDFPATSPVVPLIVLAGIAVLSLLAYRYRGQGKISDA